MMQKIAAEIPHEVANQIDRIIREGWFPTREALIREAVEQFVGSRSYLGDSPRMLLQFAADALNESKPETALKFVDRALGLVQHQKMADLPLYLALIELRVQVLVVIGRESEALASLEEAREKLPNNPTISKWIERLGTKRG